MERTTIGKMVTETASQLIQERHSNVCECCGEAPAEQAHHCLYGKDNKNKVAKKLLNMTYNLMLVCAACHARAAKSHENKVRFWEMQCQRYGREVMVAWHNLLPYKVKEKEYC